VYNKRVVAEKRILGISDEEGLMMCISLSFLSILLNTLKKGNTMKDKRMTSNDLLDELNETLVEVRKIDKMIYKLTKRVILGEYLPKGLDKVRK